MRVEENRFSLSLLNSKLLIKTIIKMIWINKRKNKNRAVIAKELKKTIKKRVKTDNMIAVFLSKGKCKKKIVWYKFRTMITLRSRQFLPTKNRSSAGIKKCLVTDLIKKEEMSAF